MWPSTFFKLESTKKPDWAVYSKLGSPITSIKKKYDLVVISSGYGGSIAASRCARAGKSVCVLERGKEWLPGDFPETFNLVAKQIQATFGGKPKTYGKPNNLLDFFVTDDLTVLSGSGLGGTSLINANVALDMDPAVLQDSAWPKEIRDDADQMNTVDRGHFFDTIKPEAYPSSYPALHKIDRMKESLRKYDIEDLGEKILSKLPLYVTFEDKLTNLVGVPQPKCTACGNCVGGCNVGSKNTLNMNYLPDAKAHGAEIFTENFLDVNKEMQKMTGGLEGVFVINPQWHPALGNSVITGHPLGGCSMGETGQTGVVNHAGLVFDGNTGQVMDGLLVVDGAIVLRPLGVNPSLTIAILAERFLRLLAQREGWNIDYDNFIPLSGSK